MFNLTNSVRIPKVTTLSPVKDVIAEIRYKDGVVSEIFAGMLYRTFKNKIKDCEAL